MLCQFFPVVSNIDIFQGVVSKWEIPVLWQAYYSPNTSSGSIYLFSLMCNENDSIAGLPANPYTPSVVNCCPCVTEMCIQPQLKSFFKQRFVGSSFSVISVILIGFSNDGRTKQDIWRNHFGPWGIIMDICIFLTFYRQNYFSGKRWVGYLITGSCSPNHQDLLSDRWFENSIFLASHRWEPAACLCHVWHST